MHAFSIWLGHTSASGLIRDTTWIIPGVQTVHILCVALVISAALLLNLRAAGVLATQVPLSSFAVRYAPAFWIALPILLLSGLILIVGEPERDLGTVVFWLKMGLVVAAILVTLAILAPLRRDPGFWDTRGGRRWLAWCGLALWAAIVFCGRWIAYTY